MPMTLGEAKKVARLAVKRFGVDADRALRTLNHVAKAQRRGDTLDIVDELERQELITAAQAHALHAAAGRNGAAELTPVTQIAVQAPAVSLSVAPSAPPLSSTARTGLLPA